MKDLEHKIKDFYLHKELPEDALLRILRAGNADTKDTNQELRVAGSTHDTIGSQWLKLSKLSTVVALVASLMLTVSLFIYYPTKKIEELVYKEVAMNHNKQLDVEFNDKDYHTLTQAMTKLEFPLVEPHRIGDNYSLIGGRYCSIQGALAAQLKVKNTTTGNLDTLYIAPLTENLNKISAKKFSYNGVVIRLWHTKELFYALASNNLK